MDGVESALCADSVGAESSRNILWNGEGYLVGWEANAFLDSNQNSLDSMLTP